MPLRRLSARPQLVTSPGVDPVPRGEAQTKRFSPANVSSPACTMTPCVVKRVVPRAIRFIVVGTCGFIEGRILKQRAQVKDRMIHIVRQVVRERIAE